MIVCLCKVVTDCEVRDAIDAGADSVEGVAQLCGAGTGCGACQTVVESMIEERQCGGCPRAQRQLATIAASPSERAA